MNETSSILQELWAERARQDEKYGEQNHTNGTNAKFKPMADSARNATLRARAGGGDPSWLTVLKETMWGAGAEADPAKLRAELIKVGAVAVAWIECIDRARESSP